MADRVRRRDPGQVRHNHLVKPNSEGQQSDVKRARESALGPGLGFARVPLQHGPLLTSEKIPGTRRIVRVSPSSRLNSGDHPNTRRALAAVK
jgi:hypothetical protein